MPAKRQRSDDAEPAAKKGAKSEGSPNDNICKVFEELMVYESKDGNKWAGVAYSKVVNALRSLSKPLTGGSDVAHMQGVGKASVEKIDEYLTTGKIQKLDDLKSLHGALPTGMILPTKSAGKGKTGKVEGAKPLTKAQQAALKKAVEKYESLSVQQLKDLCKQNKQVQTGAKSDLVHRCADGSVLGAIPICPFCGAGKLRFDGATGIYKCPGYTDDDKYMPCVFSGTDVVRTPWQE